MGEVSRSIMLSKCCPFVLTPGLTCLRSVDDKSSRYVAQENVVPLGPEEFTAADAERSFNVQIGQWFRRFDAEKAVFVSNIKHEYPDD